MDDDTSAQFRLSVWRDLAAPHQLVIYDEQSGLRVVSNDSPAQGSDSSLQAEVYSWPLPQEPFAGIKDEQLRQRLREALHDRLDVSQPPATRGFAVLCDFVAKAERAIADGSAGPIPSDLPSTEPSTRWASEPNPLLSLVLHLKWLVECFKNRPGMSVSIR